MESRISTPNMRGKFPGRSPSRKLVSRKTSSAAVAAKPTQKPVQMRFVRRS